MEGRAPREIFPSIGTVENPAFFCDGRDLLLCYEIAPASDGGNAVLAFSNVIYFEQNPSNVEGLRASRYPVRAWDFTEIFGSDRTERWRPLSCRFWTISFNDTTVEIVFSEVRQIYQTREAVSPHLALLDFLNAHYKPGSEGQSDR